MALIDDIFSAKKLWGNPSIPKRISIIVSTVLASGALASLADIIFAWKGFILDGITFYREWVVLPIGKLASVFNLELSSNGVDFLIIYCLFLAAILRKIWISSDVIMKFVAVAAFAYIIYFICAYFANSELITKNYWVIYLTFGFILIYPLLRKFTNNEKIAYYLPIIASLGLVLILGAVNEGLSRSI